MEGTDIMKTKPRFRPLTRGIVREGDQVRFKWRDGWAPWMLCISSIGRPVNRRFRIAFDHQFRRPINKPRGKK